MQSVRDWHWQSYNSVSVSDSTASAEVRTVIAETQLIQPDEIEPSASP